jgi:hypothetical protein
MPTLRAESVPNGVLQADSKCNPFVYILYSTTCSTVRADACVYNFSWAPVNWVHEVYVHFTCLVSCRSSFRSVVSRVRSWVQGRTGLRKWIGQRAAEMWWLVYVGRGRRGSVWCGGFFFIWWGGT